MGKVDANPSQKNVKCNIINNRLILFVEVENEIHKSCERISTKTRFN